jgi:hypothetical protein
MADADRFRKNAEEAERGAKAARTDHDRDAYLKIAEGWRALLAQTEAKARGLNVEP